MENSENYLNAAKLELKDINIGNFYQDSLQNFKPTHRYDCIWVQWVAIYLTDADLINFLKRA